MPSTQHSQNSACAGILHQPPPRCARHASFPSNSPSAPPPHYLRKHLNRSRPWVSQENEPAPAVAVCPAPVPRLPQTLDQPPLQRAGGGGSAPCLSQHPPPSSASQPWPRQPNPGSPLAELPPSILHPFQGTLPSSPTPSQGWGCPQQTPQVLTESPPCWQLIPSLTARSAASLPAAQPWSRGGRGCAASSAQGPSGGRETKIPLEYCCQGNAASCGGKAEQRLSGWGGGWEDVRDRLCPRRAAASVGGLPSSRSGSDAGADAPPGWPVLSLPAFLHWGTVPLLHSPTTTG